MAAASIRYTPGTYPWSGEPSSSTTTSSSYRPSATPSASSPRPLRSGFTCAAWPSTPCCKPASATSKRRLATDDGKPVYTYDVLRYLQQRLPLPSSLLVGPDIAAEWHRWHRHADIDREFGRLSLPATHAIRSSDIRQQLRQGVPPASLGGMIPDAVAVYIAAQGLYR